MKVLALDYGSARTGVAVSDPTGTVARPLAVVEAADSDRGLARIVDIVRREEIERIVVGLPVSLNGEIGPQALEVQAFAEQLRAATNTEVVLYDERLSSVEADRHLQAAGLRGKQARERRDAVAAAIILQAYLDSLRAPPLPSIE